MKMLQRSAALMLALGVGSGCYSGSSSDPAGDDPQGEGTSDSEGSGDSGDDDNPVPPDLDPDTVPEPLAARLNDIQYAYTVLDLLGTELTDQEQGLLPRDVPIDGTYSTSSEAQSFSTQYVLGYAYIARSLSERLDPGTLLMEHGGCNSVDPSCLEDFVEGLGLRAFRRPLTGEERTSFLALGEQIASIDETTDDDVVRGLVQAILQAPPFIYRLEGEREGEAGVVRRTTGWELASRLSYFLWQSAPDDELLAFAAGSDGDGDYDPSALPGQIDRMMADPRFARSRQVFWGDYSLASTSAFGSIDPELAEQLRESLMASFDRLSGVGAPPEPLSALFDGDTLVMTPAVAELAGVASLGDGLQVYEGVSDRQGLITHPGFLAALGTNSFVGRGVFMTERLLCQHQQSPPDDLADAIDETNNATTDMTPREASEFRFGLDAVCRACHMQFEPISYAFERYDMSGRYVLTDDQGRDLFAHGVLPAQGERPEIEFGSAPELLGELADRPEINHCMVENMMEYGSGVPPVDSEEFLRLAQERYESEGLTFDALVSAVAGSERFTFLRTVTE
ncbi:MAG: DUF1588 domain-containing protein [Myxococcota bacterium]